ncbi:apses-domain-containing protein [Basidiobolus meristosporus CBS 931.73]|uniref:Apses-domain-containing protein n=1 Tax=Basidiobolus meristosporus CBS 931.73 TaxID=1314790 RepID=A0A1Y1YCC1_9FUNG|nr:apses-domain-containing protein [Basidiobolus meristosporus CBS 931.73]|eukprot:ORX95638.1 apses-domain-containing protein [Basidiobolus meristosporus CBS 931.73]
MSQIFKATYSGVPVYEMTCRGVAVMRRRHDSALNATQLLKVANFDKPQRTRILEREVQIGEHEKVQGGYGKYQGTWVPFERGVALATQYEVLELLRPLFDYQPNSASPPPAPKHTVHTTSRQRKKKEDKLDKEILKASKPVRKTGGKNNQHRRRPQQETEYSDSSTTEAPTLSDTDSELTSVDSDMTLDSDSDDSLMNPPPKRSKGTTSVKVEQSEELYGRKAESGRESKESTPSKHAGMLRDYFTSNSQDIPEMLRGPLSFDINDPIDEEGNNCLHWAASTGRIALAKSLISIGGDIHSRNRLGHTPLVHSVFFPVNYDRGTFIHLLDLALDSIGDYDGQYQTIFHHLCKLLSANQDESQLYYLTCLLEKLKKTPKAKNLILNMKDKSGNTALDIANRSSNASIAPLLRHACTASTNTVDRLLDEGYQRETVLKAISFRSGTRSPSPEIQHHVSCLEASRKILPSVTQALQDIEAAHHHELDELNRQLFSTRAILASVIEEVQEARLTINKLHQSVRPYEHTLSQTRQLENQLTEAIQLRYQLQREISETESADIKSAGHVFDQAADDMIKEIMDLRKDIEDMESNHKTLIKEMVQLARHQPLGDQPLSSEYKRVIAMCCDIPLETVDSIAQPLMEILALEEPFSQL